MSEANANIETRQGFWGFWRKKVSIATAVPIVLVAFLPEAFRHFHRPNVIPPLDATGPRPLGIQDLVREVKAELSGAENEMRAKGEAALFNLETFEMELNFIVRADSTAKLGAHTELVMAESEIQTGSEKVQKLTLHWKATPPAPLSPTNVAPASLTGEVIIQTPKSPEKKGNEF